MPELPEVETIVNQLKKKVLSKTILSIDIFNFNVVDKKIKNCLPAKILDIFRRGKSILFQLSSGNYLHVHLRMTGHFHFVESEQNKSYQDYLVAKFNFGDGTFLTHNSIRCFGSIRLIDEKMLQKELCKLGVEPLHEDFTSKKFVLLMQKFPNAIIKNKLLDQSVIAGVGNIYAQEALYLAGILPQKKIKDINDKRLSLLHQELQRILKLSIQNQGTTVNNYAHITGKGNFQNLLTVYNKDKCPQGHQLNKVNIGGRGTSFCPLCQR